MDGLSPHERLILAEIELELRHTEARLANRLSAFNARAGEDGPQRFAPQVSNWEVVAVLAMVLLISGIMTLFVLSC
ncbi:DUF3040 domain-containing protein [Nonomuraea sp. NPDC049421]|uniref:DUF3040 domain-containing protein n=1 Tax=Nonomuraea salmonea TaxID=46181 RepID=A0ABV5P1J4_9ACTN